jgi:hypothetical protein
VGNEEADPKGSDLTGLLADLLEGARRRNLSANSLAAHERTWRTFLAWAAALNIDPPSLPLSQAGANVAHGSTPSAQASSSPRLPRMNLLGHAAKGIGA